jgi:LmbE family N-acetylglucosaminyl deacetylase
MRVLAVGAHPDDLEISCGGTLVRYVQRGDDVVMAHASNGDKGSFDRGAEEIARIRDAEARRSAEIAGASHVSLGIPDGDILAGDREQRRLVVDLVRETRPDLIITHHPDDYHSDHTDLSKLVFDGSFLAALPNLETGAPCVPAVPPIYYMETFAGLAFNPTEFVDIGDAIEVKLEMMAAHASQLDWIRDRHDGAEMVDQLRANARFRGLQCGALYAEGFVPCVKWNRATTTRLLP